MNNNINSLQNLNLKKVNQNPAFGKKASFNPALKEDKGDSYSFSTKTNTQKTNNNPIAKWFKSLMLASALAAGTMAPTSCTVEHDYEGKDVVITNEVTIDMATMNSLLQKILDKLNDMNQNIVVGNETISTQITDLFNELKNQQIDDQIFFDKITELLGNINQNVTVGDASIKEMLEALLKQYENGSINYKEMLNKILDVLGSIDNSVKRFLQSVWHQQNIYPRIDCFQGCFFWRI